MSYTDSFPMRLRRAYLAMNRCAQRACEEFDVTADQYVVLSLLRERDGVRQRDLVDRAYSDPNTVTAMLTLLERKGLVRREADPLDGRARIVRLTPAGKRLQTKLADAVAPIRSLIDQVSGGRRGELMERLDAIAVAAEQHLAEGRGD